MQHPKPTSINWFSFSGVVVMLMVVLGLPVHFVSGQADGERFSPADYRVAFVSACSPEGFPDRIFTLNLDGSGLARLTNTVQLGDELRPRWSPNGDRVEYISTLPRFVNLDGSPRPGENGILDVTEFPHIREIYYTSANNGEPTRLTYTNVGMAEIDWLDDGRLTFMPLSDNTLVLNIVNVDDFVWQPRTIEIGDYSTSFPEWSPDSLHIAFAAMRQGEYGLYVASGDGSRVTNITKELSFDPIFDVSWSPDSQQLVFRVGESSEADLYRINVDGTNPVKLNTEPLKASEMIWSPESDFIAYLGKGSISYVNGAGSGNIHIINPDGVKVVDIAFSHYVAALQWLPDQPVLVFRLDDGANSDMCPDNKYLESLYWLDLACLNTPMGCTADSAVRVPNSEVTGYDYDYDYDIVRLP